VGSSVTHVEQICGEITVIVQKRDGRSDCEKILQRVSAYAINGIVPNTNRRESVTGIGQWDRLISKN